MYADHAAHMTAILKGNRKETKKGYKKAVVWNKESNGAFVGIKQAQLSAVGLHLVDPDQGFVLRTDTSNYAIGAMLEQVLYYGKDVPVAFWSQVLAEGQRQTWTQPEIESYVIVMALGKWAGYIALRPRHGLHGLSETAAVAQRAVDTPSGPGSKTARWHKTLATFDLTVVYFRERTTP